MTLTMAKELLPKSVEKFLNIFPSAREVIDSLEIHLLTKRTYASRRNKIALECGSNKEPSTDAHAEVVHGEKGMAVIILLDTLKTEKQFFRAVWHELGHVISIYANSELHLQARADWEKNDFTLICCGMSLWSEFIAEYISLYVENAPARSAPGLDKFKLQQFSDEALNVGCFYPEPMAYYLAWFYGNNTIKAEREKSPDILIGLNCSNEMAVEILNCIMGILEQQLEEREIWNISRRRLEELGECVDAMWDACKNNSNFSLMDRIF